LVRWSLTFSKEIRFIVSRFKVGDRVRWTHASPGLDHGIGVVVAVIPNDKQLDQFTAYDVQFGSKLITLLGTQVESADGIRTV
jgi:hypothetical protein